MAIHERLLNHDTPPESSDSTWFAVRQPGIVRFLAERLQGDALALGLAAAYRIAQAFQVHDGVPAKRLTSALLVCAEEAVHDERPGQDAARDATVVTRQPALTAWIAQLMDDPPVVLDRHQRREVGMALLAVTHALDALEQT